MALAPNTTSELLSTAKKWKGTTDLTPVNDSVVDTVNRITKQDSPLMRAAHTEGLKVANRRGLLNSSLAAQASQTAALDKAVPIAQQEAAQNFSRNQAARDFEYGMASQGFGQDWQSKETALDRDFQGGQAALDRQLQERMQSKQISAADRQQIRDIASREGLAKAERALQEKLQQREIGFQTGQARLDRDLQKQIASWNLSASDRQAASQLLATMGAIYDQQYRQILDMQDISSEQRSNYLKAAQNWRNKQFNLVEQIWDVNLKW